MPAVDERDSAILAGLRAKWESVDGARVGDYVRMLDGSLRRFTHHWGDSIQTTCGGSHPCAEDQSFRFCGHSMSFSGSLDSAIPVKSLRDTGEIKDGRAWFFHHGDVRAHNGVTVLVPCRVYEVYEVCNV